MPIRNPDQEGATLGHEGMKTMKEVLVNTLIKIGIRFAVGWISVFLAVLVLTSPPAYAAESSCPGIYVKILHIRNNTGTIDCALFDSPDGFPENALRSAKYAMVLKIQETQATCNFEGISPGTYALAVIHDENMNGKLDTNIFGIPIEGYGFSNGARALLHAPSFSAASFRYDGGSLDLTMSLHY
jgi:uncharacterized protein (DUF2141 family)